MLNATPVLPSGIHNWGSVISLSKGNISLDLDDATDMDTIEMVSDNPQCVSFGLFMIWFSSITINLGPTFLREGFKKNPKKDLNHFVRKNFNDEKNE